MEHAAKPNRLAIATLILVAMLAITIWTIIAQKQKVNAPLPAGATLPSIGKDNLDEIALHTPDKETVTMRKNGSSWRITAPISAEPDSSAVDQMVTKLTELKVTGIAATHQDNHALLEVDDAHGIRVTAKSKGKVLADLIVGASKGGSTMMREHGQDTVLSVDGPVRWTFNKDLKALRNRTVTDVSADDFVSVNFQSPNGSFAFENKDGSWKFLGKKPIAKFSETKLKSLVGSIAKISASDFAAPDINETQAGVDTDSKTLITASLKAKDNSPAQTLTLRVGATVPGNENQFFLKRDDQTTIYIVTKYLAERLMPKLDAFQETETKAGEAPTEPPPDMPPMGGPGGQQIPPELMEQLQRQMQQQQH